MLCYSWKQGSPRQEPDPRNPPPKTAPLSPGGWACPGTPNQDCSLPTLAWGDALCIGTIQFDRSLL